MARFELWPIIKNLQLTCFMTILILYFLTYMVVFHGERMRYKLPWNSRACMLNLNVKQFSEYGDTEQASHSDALHSPT